MFLVVDIDNTISCSKHREGLLDLDPPDWKNFLSPEAAALDIPIKLAQKCLPILMKHAYTTHVVTGREERLRSVTTKWLLDNFGLSLDDAHLHMRPRRSKDELDKFLEDPAAYVKSRSAKFTSASKHKENIVLNKLIPANTKRRPFVFIDDDPYVLPMYSNYGLALKAPECWKLFLHEAPDEPEGALAK